jgi:isopenicillin-N epimerase
MKNAFLLDPDLTFLNHGSFGACPREVFAEFQRWQLEMERNPVEFLGRRSALLLRDARGVLAAMLGTSADRLAWIANATTGVNIVARSLALRPGDEVLATDHEYGACDATWRFVCERNGAIYRQVAIPLPFDRDAFAERVLAAVTPRTRVIFASHVTSTTALAFPLAEVCARARELGILTLIDGAHAPGHIALDLDALGADFYTGNCHKWLCAPKSSGFLHARPEHHAMLDAGVVSWGRVADLQGHTGFDAYVGSTLLERRFQWLGTRDIAAFLAVPAAIRFQQQHDWPALRQRCHTLLRQAQQALCDRYGLPPIALHDAGLQMAAIAVPHRDAEALRARLFAESRIEVPITQHAGQTFVRVSVQVYNEGSDIERLLAAPALAVP